MNAKIDETWNKLIGSEFQLDYMQTLKSFLQQEKNSNTIYPPFSNLFSAFNYTPADRVKVVILGQDPYHGPNQANGLCFSVSKGVRLPPSLVNIYRALNNDLGCQPVNHGVLESWAQQGVLLLNSVLTVREGNAGSHQGKGWERFTDKVIEQLSINYNNIVFMLWGKYAERKGAVVDTMRHKVLTAVHPSPLSAHRGFLQCKHFSKANTYLEEHGITPIDWKLPEC